MYKVCNNTIQTNKSGTNKSEMHNSKVGLVENSPEIYDQQQGCARVTGQGHHCKGM
jgi:hypothetical protein